MPVVKIVWPPSARRFLENADARPAIASTLQLSALPPLTISNRRAITTVSDKRWHTVQVSRARKRLGLVEAVPAA